MVDNYKDEEAMYPDIIESIKYYLKLYDYDFKIYETWHEFKPDFISRFQREIDILKDFGKPDITVFYKNKNMDDYKVLIIEAKKKSIVLKDIAQAKMYGDIFNADKVFLVSLHDLRRKIEQYYYVNKNIFKYSEGREIKFVKLYSRNLQLQQAIPVGGELF